MKSQDAGKADYSYWLMVRVWSAHEAAALFLGYEPDYANYHYCSIPFGDDDPPEDTNRTAISAERQNLEKILESAQLAGELGKVQLNQIGEPWGKTVTWRKWISWAKENHIACADALLNALDEHAKREQDTRESNLNPRRETTLLRTIAVLLHLLAHKEGFRSEASIIEEVKDLFGHIPGIAKSTMERDFAEAKRRLTDY